MAENWKAGLKDRIFQKETISELARNLTFVLPHVRNSILSKDQAKARLGNEKSAKEGKLRVSYNKDTRELCLFLFDEQGTEPISGLMLELSSDPDASDVKFCKDFLRVFNADVLSAPSILSDKELWTTLQQTRFARAIGRFSPFSTENFMRWLHVVESAGSLRYEGHPFAACIFMTKQMSWVESSSALEFIKFESLMRFEEAVLKEKWTRALLRDPLIGLVGLSLQGSIVGVATFKASAVSGVTFAPHEELIPIASAVVPGTMAFVSSLHGDLYILFPNGATFVKSQGRWRYFNYSSLTKIVGRLVPSEIAQGLVRVILDLSYERKGGLIVILPNETKIEKVIPDHLVVSRSNGALRKFSQGLKIEDASHRRVLTSGAGIDGAIVVSGDGRVMDCACMIGEPSLPDCKNIGKTGLQKFAGARTTAAWNASVYGVAIKISEDGPITIFEKGNIVLQLG